MRILSICCMLILTVCCNAVHAIPMDPIQIGEFSITAGSNAAKYTPIGAIGTEIVGEAWTVGPPLPTSAGVAAGMALLDTDLVQAIKEAQADISSEVASLRNGIGVGKSIDFEAMRKIARAQVQDILDGMRNLKIIELEQKAKQAILMGRPLGACEELAAGGAMKNGGSAAAQIRAELSDVSAEHGDGTQKSETAVNYDYTLLLRDIFKAACLNGGPGEHCDPKATMPQAVTHFPVNDTHDEENLAKAKISTQYAMNPHPTPMVTNPQSAEGKAAILEQAKKDASIAPGIAGDDFVTSLQAPTVDWNSLQELLKELGVDDWDATLSGSKATDPNAVVTTKDGQRVSILKALDLISQKGFSATWLTHVKDAEDEKGLLEEILRFEAIRTYISVLQLRLDMYRTSIAAHNLGLQADTTLNPQIKANIFAPGHAPVNAATSNP